MFSVVPRRFNSINALLKNIEEHSKLHKVVNILFSIEKLNKRGNTTKESSMIFKASDNIRNTIGYLKNAYVKQTGKFANSGENKLSKSSYCLSYQIEYDDESIEFYQVWYPNLSLLRADKNNLIRLSKVQNSINRARQR